MSKKTSSEAKENRAPKDAKVEDQAVDQQTPLPSTPAEVEAKSVEAAGGLTPQDQSLVYDSGRAEQIATQFLPNDRHNIKWLADAIDAFAQSEREKGVAEAEQHKTMAAEREAFDRHQQELLDASMVEYAKKQFEASKVVDEAAAKDQDREKAAELYAQNERVWASQDHSDPAPEGAAPNAVYGDKVKVAQAEQDKAAREANDKK